MNKKSTTTTKVVKTEEGKNTVELSPAGEKQSADLKKVMTPKVKQSSGSKATSKYLDGSAVRNILAVAERKLHNLKEAETEVIKCAIELGKELYALQTGMPRGEFYPKAEKELNLKKAMIKLYVSVFRYQDVVKDCKSLREARTAITEHRSAIADPSKADKPASAKKSGNVARISNSTGNTAVKELSPSEAADVIIEAILNTIAKMPKENQVPTIQNLKALVANLPEVVDHELSA